MKKIFFLAVAMLCIACHSFSQNKKTTIQDGAYQVVALSIDNKTLIQGTKNQIVIPFDTNATKNEYANVLIDTLAFVPLELDSKPVIEKLDQQKFISITFNAQSTNKMKSFSAKHINQAVVLVLDGKAVSMHTIRAAITSNKMQISGCKDQECEKLCVRLQQNLK